LRRGRTARCCDGIRRPDSGWAAGTYRGEYIGRRTEGGETRIVVEIIREIELR
jgi:hypothetical protein